MVAIDGGAIGVNVWTGAGVGGLGKEAKSGTGIDGCLQCMVAIDGEGIGVDFKGRVNVDMKLEPMMSKNDLAVVG